MAENTVQLKEMYRISFENKYDGLIQTSVDKGKTWLTIGKIIKPTQGINANGYTASKWGLNGSVVATAVNAIHIKTAQNKENNKGIIFSILPQEQLSISADKYKSYLSSSSSIYTDIAAGTKIFGGKWSTLIGNLVYLEKSHKNLPLPYNYTPKISDKLVVIVSRPTPYPLEVIFENRFGGIIHLKYADGSVKEIGQVLKPVLGVGRFLGTIYSSTGRVRANHNGVIDVSTSPVGKTGGFQIIPANHGESKEMLSAKTKTQWMIVAPLNALDPSPEGTSPLFSGFIIPRYIATDFSNKSNWKEQVSQRTLVQVKYKGQEKWSAMPTFITNPKKPLPNNAYTCLKDIDEIKILFPIFLNSQEKKQWIKFPEMQSIN